MQARWEPLSRSGWKDWRRLELLLDPQEETDEAGYQADNQDEEDWEPNVHIKQRERGSEQSVKTDQAKDDAERWSQERPHDDKLVRHER